MSNICRTKYLKARRFKVVGGLLLLLCCIPFLLDFVGIVQSIVYVSSHKGPFLCVEFTGGLGNLMFEYASAYAIAKKKNMTLLLSEGNELTRIFHLSGTILPHAPCWMLTKHTEKRSCAFDEETTNFDGKKSVALKGYLQSWKYFHDVKKDIRHAFTFSKTVKQSAEMILCQAVEKHNAKRKAEVTLIGVHVRRGDMTWDHYKRHGYFVATKEYLQKAMNYFESKFNHVLFIVCSDDMVWTKRNIAGENVEFMQDNSKEVDLAILSSCDHIIMSVGSFGWWSAWLSGGNVTYYTPAVRPDSALRQAFSKDMEDYFYPGWVSLSSSKITVS